MKIKNMLGQIEKLFGRVPEKYMLELINDGLEEIGITKQHKRDEMKTDLIKNQRWYPLDDEVIDIIRVEILSKSSGGSCSDSSYSTQQTCEANGETWTESGNRYTMIPKLTDPHKLLKEDEY